MTFQAFDLPFQEDAFQQEVEIFVEPNTEHCDVFFQQEVLVVFAY